MAMALKNLGAAISLVFMPGPYCTHRATYDTGPSRATPLLTMPARLLPRSETPYQIAQDAAAKAAILEAWASGTGRPSDVASALGVSLSTLYREIRRLGMGAELPGYASVA